MNFSLVSAERKQWQVILYCLIAERKWENGGKFDYMVFDCFIPSAIYTKLKLIGLSGFDGEVYFCSLSRS